MVPYRKLPCQATFYGAGVRVPAALGEVERDAGTAEVLVILCLDGDVCALYVCMTS